MDEKTPRTVSGKWVPLEPTAEMIQAMEDRMYEGSTYVDENSISYHLWKEVYKAMLDAVPQETDTGTLP